MGKRKSVGLVVVFVMFFVFGCKNNPTGNYISLDEEAMEEIINQEGFLAYDAYYGEEDTLSAPVIQTRDIIALKFLWYREIKHLNKQLEIDIVNDSAFVTISTRVDGLFHILALDTAANPDSVIDYQKDLGDNFMSYAVFKRYPEEILHRGWRLESLTGVEVNSDSVEVQIDSIRINCESYVDTVIVSPWVLFQRGELLTFGREEEVTLTIYSDDEIYAFLHAHGWGHWRRWKFDEMESYPTIFRGRWRTSIIPGGKLVIFDVLHQNTLDEEDCKYNSNVWIFPYWVAN